MPVPVISAAASAELGSEQALLALLPYRLPADAAPAGYLQQDETASTNAAIAFGAAEEDRAGTLQRLVGAGRITGLQQTFAPAAGSTDPSVALLIGLYRDAGAAAAAVATTVPPAESGAAEDLIAPSLGDGARALKRRAEDGSSTTFLIAWSRGPLFFAVTLRAAGALPEPGTEFAQALDANAVARARSGRLRPTASPTRRLRSTGA